LQEIEKARVAFTQQGLGDVQRQVGVYAGMGYFMEKAAVNKVV
jgi:hypothetical protein